MCDRDPVWWRRVMSRLAIGLCYGVSPIDTDTLARLRAHAYQAGRVIEREGLMILGFRTAAVLGLPGGLADPPASGLPLLISRRSLPFVTPDRPRRRPRPVTTKTLSRYLSRSARSPSSAWHRASSSSRR